MYPMTRYPGYPGYACTDPFRWLSSQLSPYTYPSPYVSPNNCRPCTNCLPATNAMPVGVNPYCNSCPQRRYFQYR